MSKTPVLFSRRPSAWFWKQEHCYPANVAASSGSRFAISRRNGASHANEIILRLNWPCGATFTFLSPKELISAQIESPDDWRFLDATKGHALLNAVYSFLQFPCLKFAVIG
jgi:hypothetical protein